MTERAAIYCRISSDREGLRVGVSRQEDDCRSLAARSGWAVADVFVDNDTSAYSGRRRPAYQRLLEDLRAGAFDVIVAWHPDRLHRSPIELEDFISLVETRGVRVATVQTGLWDLSTASGRLTARQLGAVARYESEHRSDRSRRALEQNAYAGRPHGKRAYGWDRLPTQSRRTELQEVVNEDEAVVVRRIAESILRGDSLRSIASALNADGIPSPTGLKWETITVRHIAKRERNAGHRVYRGRVVGPGNWEPILDEATQRQVSAVLADPRRRTSSGTAAAHLLSGIAKCGVCGARMRAAMNGSVPSYRCAAGSCVSRRRDQVDAVVRAAVLGRLALPDAGDLLGGRNVSAVNDAMAEVERLTQRLEDAARDAARDEITPGQLRAMNAELRPRLEAAERRARAVADHHLMAGVPADAGALAAAWDTWSLTRQRSIVDAVVRIRILPVGAGAPFDPASIEIIWRSE